MPLCRISKSLADDDCTIRGKSGRQPHLLPQIRQLSVDIDAQNIDNVRMDILSMGMTGDYMVAIEEGATWFVLEPEFSVKDIIKNKVVKNEYY